MSYTLEYSFYIIKEAFHHYKAKAVTGVAALGTLAMLSACSVPEDDVISVIECEKGASKKSVGTLVIPEGKQRIINETRPPTQIKLLARSSGGLRIEKLRTGLPPAPPIDIYLPETSVTMQFADKTYVITSRGVRSAEQVSSVVDISATCHTD